MINTVQESIVSDDLGSGNTVTLLFAENKTDYVSKVI